MERKEVFISYKSEDFDQAYWLKSMLETNGISCWMAPASIPGGSNYAKEIPQAIENCRVFVLVLTERCQTSIWIPKELDRALNARKPVMPFALENCRYNDDFNFYLSNVQQYAAYQNKLDAARALLRDIRALLDVPQEPIRMVTPPVQGKLSGKTRKFAGKAVLAVAAVLVLLAAVALIGKFGGEPLPGQDISALDPSDVSYESVAYLSDKAETYLCNYGVDRVGLYHKDGANSDLYADMLASCCTDFTTLEKGYAVTDGEGGGTLVLPFCISMEDVPYHWMENVYYEDPLLVDYPALYGYAAFRDVSFDKKGNLEEAEGFDLRISDLYESEERMMIVLSEAFPQGLKEGTLEADPNQ